MLRQSQRLGEGFDRRTGLIAVVRPPAEPVNLTITLSSAIIR